MGRYSEAKNCFLKGQEHQDEMGIKQWITWCDEKMLKLGIKGDKDASYSKKEVKEATKSETQTKLEEHITSTSNGNKIHEVEQSLQMPTPKIKHDWYQTEVQVVIPK